MACNGVPQKEQNFFFRFKIFLLGAFKSSKLKMGGLEILNFQIGGPGEKMINFSQTTQPPPCHK